MKSEARRAGGIGDGGGWHYRERLHGQALFSLASPGRRKAWVGGRPGAAGRAPSPGDLVPLWEEEGRCAGHFNRSSRSRMK